MKKLLCLTFFTFLFSCNNEKSSMQTLQKEKIEGSFVCNLQENKAVIGKVKDFLFCENSFFVLADDNIIEYSKTGEQKTVFTKRDKE